MQATLDELLITTRRILEQAYLRAIVGPSGTPPADEVIQQERLVHYAPFIEAQMMQLQEVLQLAGNAGAQRLHNALHNRPGIDHEMLDEAIDFAEERDDR
jgi:hypothetical protein